MNLTNQEIDALIEAMDQWERADPIGPVFDGLISGMIPKDSIERAKWDEEKRQRREEERRSAKLRRERSIIIKAKLLQMRDSASADQVLAESSRA